MSFWTGYMFMFRFSKLCCFGPDKTTEIFWLENQFHPHENKITHIIKRKIQPVCDNNIHPVCDKTK